MRIEINQPKSVSVLRTALIGSVLFLMSGLFAQAGSTVDMGTLPGTPAVGTINYLAWYNAATPPTQVLTEDGFNSAAGQDQGYFLVLSTPTWILNASNFMPNPSDGVTMNMLFGGIGAQAGNIWTYSFTYDSDTPVTSHGTVGTAGSGNCPTMTPGSQGVGGKVLNWTSTGASGYAIYRSQLPSGAGNGASNGRYDLVTTVSSGTTTYTDTACPTGTDCWHIIVPLNASNQISSCHSQESSPTAVTLRTFRSADPAVNWPLIAGGGLLVALLGGAGVYRWRLSRVRAR